MPSSPKINQNDKNKSQNQIQTQPQQQSQKYKKYQKPDTKSQWQHKKTQQKTYFDEKKYEKKSEMKKWISPKDNYYGKNDDYYQFQQKYESYDDSDYVMKYSKSLEKINNVENIDDFEKKFDSESSYHKSANFAVKFILKCIKFQKEFYFNNKFHKHFRQCNKFTQIKSKKIF